MIEEIPLLRKVILQQVSWVALVIRKVRAAQVWRKPRDSVIQDNLDNFSKIKTNKLIHQLEDISKTRSKSLLNFSQQALILSPKIRFLINFHFISFIFGGVLYEYLLIITPWKLPIFVLLFSEYFFKDFSKLAGKASHLIDSTFSKPLNSGIRFPPILDRFSRTLASP